MANGRIQSLLGYCLEASLSCISLPLSQCPPHRAPHNATCVLHESEREENKKDGNQSLHDLISRANILSLFLYSVRKKSLGFVNTQGKRITQKCEYQDIGLSGALLEAASTSTEMGMAHEKQFVI